jgi:hypothetical protein
METKLECQAAYLHTVLANGRLAMVAIKMV